MKLAIVILLFETFSFGCRGQSKSAIAESFSKARISVGNLPESVTIADVNNDKRLDLLVANQGDDNVTILIIWRPQWVSSRFRFSDHSWAGSRQHCH